MSQTILTPEVLDRLKQLDDAGEMYAIINTILDFINDGIEKGDFTQEEACHDLDIALWISYANNNLDDYLRYVSSVKWLSDVEDLAAGCGAWYYRYAVSLMYLGRIDEALKYAEEGVRQEPDYPWGWLILSALRAHHGDKSGALQAVERGLELVPGDYEFLQRRREIEAGYPLDVMENHYISPDADAKLHDVTNTDMDDERRAKALSVSTILCDTLNLEKIKKVLPPMTLSNDAFFCSCTIPLAARDVSLRFIMNEAGLSKFDVEWVARLRSSIDHLVEEACHWIDEKSRHEINVADLHLHSIDVNIDRSFEIYFKRTDEPDSDLLQIYFTPDFEINSMEQDNYFPETYSRDEMLVVDRHINKYMGVCAGVFHEKISPDLHIDIYVISPTPQRNYYTLVTLGMGAHVMNLPDDMPEGEWGRAELVMCLPPDWNIQSLDDKDYWPIYALKVLSRLPGNHDTFLAKGHTIPYGKPLAENTRLTGYILSDLQNFPREASYVTLPDGDKVNFYQVIPIYDEEMQYKLENGHEALFRLLAGVSPVVDIHRPNTCEGVLFTPFFDNSSAVKYKN